MTRKPVAIGALVLVAAMLVWDLQASAPLNPFTAPPLLAFGSGAPAAGAHCASLPSAD